MNKANFQTYLSDLKKSCRANGVKLILSDKKYIEHDGERYGGWFDCDKKELHCALPNTNTPFVELLIHESCHMDQWLNSDKAWLEYIKNRSSVHVWSGLKGSNIPSFNKHIRIIQKMEAECEELALEKIKHYDLNLDIKTYIQKANSYLMLYSFLKDKRKWPDYSPYRFKEIYKVMPSYKIIHDLPVTQEMKELFNLKCYKKVNR